MSSATLHRPRGASTGFSQKSSRSRPADARSSAQPQLGRVGDPAVGRLVFHPQRQAFSPQPEAGAARHLEGFGAVAEDEAVRSFAIGTELPEESFAGEAKAHTQWSFGPDGGAVPRPQGRDSPREVYDATLILVIAPDAPETAAMPAEVQVVLEPAPTGRTAIDRLLHPRQLVERGGQRERLAQDVAVLHGEDEAVLGAHSLDAGEAAVPVLPVQPRTGDTGDDGQAD